MRRKSSGFTLIEILTTIVILSIVAGLAVPTFTNAIEQSRRGEACTTLNVIHMGQKIYQLNNGTFWNPGNNPAVATVNTNLNVDISMQYYTITRIQGNATTYAATVQRVGNAAVTCIFSYDTGTGVLTKAPATFCP